MKKIVIGIMLAMSTSALAMPMVCKCTSGSMIIEIDGTKIKMSCSDGGRVECTM